MHGPTRIFWANLTPFSLEATLAARPVAWWQGDGTVFVGEPTSLEFFPCRPLFLFDAGQTAMPLDCLNGLPGTMELELDADHDCAPPLSPRFSFRLSSIPPPWAF